jgi:hypothetical protein
MIMEGGMRTHRGLVHWATAIALAGTLSIAGPTVVKAENITFRISFAKSVKLPPDTRMVGIISMKKLGQKYETAATFIVPNPGVERTNQIKCSEPGIFFTAEVRNIIYELDELVPEKKCQSGEIPFVFREKKHAAFLKAALKENAVPTTAPQIPVNVAGYATDLRIAVQNKDTTTALVTSSQLNYALSKAGYKTLAEPYRVMNLDLAKTKLISAGKLEPGSEALYYDPLQKKYVLDDRTVELIKNFQKEQRLTADGKLGWDTIKMLGKVD